MEFVKENFATADVARAKRFAAWHRLVEQFHYGFRFDTGVATPFRGSCQRLATADYQVVAFDEDQAHFRRESRHIRSDGIGVVELFTPLRGNCSVSQFGKTADCRPGSLVIIDAAAPFEIFHTDRMSALIFKTPRSALSSAMHDPERYCGRAIGASSGLPRMTLDLFRTIARQGGVLKGPQFRQACHSLLGFLALLVEDDSRHIAPGSRIRRHTRQRLKNYIREHAHDPTLGTGDIGLAFGLSSRYVQMLFRDEGTTVRDFLRRQRLELARQALSSVTDSDRTVTEIAYRCGFSSSAHFSTTFKQAYDSSPRAYRLRHRVLR